MADCSGGGGFSGGGGGGGDGGGFSGGGGFNGGGFSGSDAGASAAAASAAAFMQQQQFAQQQPFHAFTRNRQERAKKRTSEPQSTRAVANPSRYNPTPSRNHAAAAPAAPSARTAATAANEEAQWSLKDILWQGRECKIITQNHNGPCSLIALCNILLLRGELEITPPDRPVVSYSYLSQLLAEHLLSKVSNEGFGGEELEAALSTLPRTQYGLDVDVGFGSITSFAATPGNDGGAGELALFRLCGVQLVHGWLPDPADAETYQAVQAAGSYNKATDVVVRGDEIADGAVVRDRGVGALAATLASQSTSSSNGKQPERQAWTDEQSATVRHALALQSFLDTQSTQLTYHGLFVLAQEIPAGQPVALFRNSHLSVLYRRMPHEGVDAAAAEVASASMPPTLFTLATDASFLMADEIVWESLVDVDGASSEFYDGKFHKSTLRQGDYVGQDVNGIGGASEGQGGVHQHNEDADYALAMQIYQNDQERLDRREQRRRSRQPQQNRTQPRGAQAPLSAAPPAPRAQPVFETPSEVFTTMRYEAEPSSEEGDALVVSSLIPARLQDEHAELLSGLRSMSLGGAQTAKTTANHSTNPFLKAADTGSGAAATSTSTNPFLVDTSTPVKHRLYRHIPLLEQHIERLNKSAGAICRAYSAVWSMPLLEQERSLEPQSILAAIETSLASSANSSDDSQEQVMGIRVAIRKDGSIRVTHRSVTPFPSTLADASDTAACAPSVRFDFMPTRVRAMDLEPVVFNKTDARGFYEAAKQRVGADVSALSGVREADDRCFDVVLWNDEQTEALEEPSATAPPKRLVTETSVANVLVEYVAHGGGQSRFVTPRTSTGMLDGLLRRWLVNNGLVEEEDVELDELVGRIRQGTAQIWLCNSLRGVWKVDLADPPRYGAPGSGADVNGAGRVKKTRFSSFIKGGSRTDSRNAASAPTAPSASPAEQRPPAEAVHDQVIDDLYGHRQGTSSSSSKVKGRKGKKGKDDKKDCIIM
ncbi:hypothetical protein EX895_003741 [Sporisorium graminicola]|uniref:MINDY deubiquitinase domain-containing protein n=1 Tax=Sporisorium graminicola TaxID=280036 RepID=A0A4U7KRH7_9BASI|nr:hypothetical protein EX895_003741 [Sporisorium graminicola]TKY87064.1 hypothetical protein EX895_003741 [Sporisorium graminicola]